MKKTKLFITLFFLYIIIGHLESQSGIDNNLIGTWVENNIPGFAATFEDDATYVWGYENELELEGKYKTNEEFKQLELYRNDKIYLQFYYKEYENKLLLWNFKGARGIELHIDEVFLFNRKNTTIKFPQDIPKEVYQLPEDFIGDLSICFNSEFKDLNSREDLNINVQKEGLIEIKKSTCILPFAFGNQDFIMDGKKLPSINFQTFQLDKDQFTEEQLNSIYVEVGGFNRAPRGAMNYVHKKNIEGNVFMFKVDTLKNFLYNDNIDIDFQLESD